MRVMSQGNQQRVNALTPLVGASLCVLRKPKNAVYENQLAEPCIFRLPGRWRDALVTFGVHENTFYRS